MIKLHGIPIHFDEAVPEGHAYAITPEMINRAARWWQDKMYQAMMNNLYSNNPGELDRWADDGGPVIE